VEKEKFVEFIRKFKIQIDTNQILDKKINYELFCDLLNRITEPFEFEKDFKSITSKNYLNPVEIVVFMEKFQLVKNFSIKKAIIFTVNNNYILKKKSKENLLISLEKYN
jgi:hypothetical protein